LEKEAEEGEEEEEEEQQQQEQDDAMVWLERRGPRRSARSTRRLSRVEGSDECTECVCYMKGTTALGTE
jgi:hypothetical protein